MGTSPDRQAWRQAVAAVAAKASAKFPESVGRINAAVKLALAGDVDVLPDGGAMVASRSKAGTEYYVVNGTCECPDFARAPGNFCAHRLAYGLVVRANELTAAPGDNELNQPVSQADAPATSIQLDTCQREPRHMAQVPAPLPEAPASANCHITVAGRQVQLTLRDRDETRLLQRVEALLARYPVPQTPVQASERPEGWCNRHGVQMTLHEKDGRAWWSHHTESGWCKGR